MKSSRSYNCEVPQAFETWVWCWEHRCNTNWGDGNRGSCAKRLEILLRESPERREKRCSGKHFAGEQRRDKDTYEERGQKGGTNQDSVLLQKPRGKNSKGQNVNTIAFCVEDGTEEEAPGFVPREGLGDLQESHFCAGEGVGTLPDVKERVGGEEAEVAGAARQRTWQYEE